MLGSYSPEISGPAVGNGRYGAGPAKRRSRVIDIHWRSAHSVLNSAAPAPPLPFVRRTAGVAMSGVPFAPTRSAQHRRERSQGRFSPGFGL